MYWFSGKEFSKPASAVPTTQAAGPNSWKPGDKVVNNNIKKKARDPKDRVGESPARSAAGVRDLLDDDDDPRDSVEPLGFQSEVSGTAVEDVMWFHWPIFTVLQSLLVLLLWVIFAFKDSSSWETALYAVGGLESIFPGYTALVIHSDCRDRRGEVWRWWTYQFTHAQLSHVSTNVFLALVVGIPLEGFQGTARMILKFTVGVFAAAAGHAVSNPHAGSSSVIEDGGPTVGLVGMSGGCYALLGVHMGNLLMNWKEMRYRWFVLFGLLLLIVLDVLQVQLSAGGGAIAHSAHFGGYVSGLLMGICVGRNLVLSRTECAVRIMASFVGFVLVLFCLIWFAQWPPRSIWDTVPWCMARQVNNQTFFGDGLFHCIRCQDKACEDKWLQQRFVKPVDYNMCRDLDIWDVTER